MTEKSKAIGVFDSGVGGLSVVRELLHTLGGESVIYLGDTARVPYGTKSPETVRRYARECTDFLLDRSVKHIVVACNTASAVALDAVRERSSVPVTGMIEPAARAALRASRNARIGIIGTHVTVESGAYGRALARLSTAQTLQVRSQACPLFVPLAEEGWHDHAAAHLIAEEYLGELRKNSVDTLILGCTHFPLLAGVIRQCLPGVHLVNSGSAAAQLVRKSLIVNGNGRSGAKAPPTATPRLECFVTDKVGSFTSVAERFLGFPLPHISTVLLPEIGPHSRSGAQTEQQNT